MQTNSREQLISIRRLTAKDAGCAASLLGRGMRDNPTHIQAFGSRSVRRERALKGMFTPFIRRQTEEGVVFGAFIQEALVGVAGLSIAGHCQPALADKMRTLPALLMASGPLSLWRVYRWTRVWARRDANTPPHWHLGPLAIEPQWQGQGVGSALLKRLCDQLDQHQALGYLETDRQKNVRLYERFGFTTVATEPVLGVMHWFMQRGPTVRERQWH